MIFFRKFGRSSQLSRRWQLIGGAMGLLLFVAITALTLSYDRLNKEWVPLTAIFWAYSGAPLTVPARLILGRNFGLGLALLPCAAGMWIAGGMLIGTLMGLKSRDHTPHPVKCRPPEGRRSRHLYRWTGVALIVALLFWPVRIPVSGTTIVYVLQPGGGPYVGVPVEEKWYTEGYNEGGAQEKKLTDAAGRVEFPPRLVHGWLGWRTVKRFLGDHSIYSTGRWGPFLHFQIHMPAGYWAPSDQADRTRDDLLVSYQGLGAARYLTVRNVDPDRPDVSLTSREHSDFLGDLTLVLNLRRATGEETRSLEANPRRRELLTERQQLRR